MSDYVKKLGLSHDPFVATARCRSFFTGAGREQLLQRLLEQAHYGAPISLVCGGLGSGKTTLAREFRNGFSEEALCVHVQATLFMNQGQFLEALLEQLPVGASSPEATDIVNDLCQFAERLYLDAKTLVLIVDDAHELASEVLQIIEMLTANASEGAVHVLLLGEKQLGNMFSNALGEKAMGRVIEEHLTPLSAVDAEAYVQLKLADAGYQRVLPLDTARIGVIANEANGVPGSINHHAGLALDKALTEQPELAPPADPRSLLQIGAPYWMTAATLLLLLLLLVTLTTPATDEADVAQSGSEEPATTRIDLSLPVGSAASAAAMPTAAENTIATGNAAVSNIPEPLATAATVLADSAGAEPEFGAARGRENREVAAESRSLQELEGSAPAVAEAADGSGSSIASMKHPLLAYPAENFTVQIMGSRSEENVQRFIATQLAGFNAVYFETLHQELPWYVVVMGNFVSRDVASRAISDLPSAIRRMDPFIRKIGDVQAVIR